jgi:hypothetical protein
MVRLTSVAGLAALLLCAPAVGKGGSAFDRRVAHPGDAVSLGVTSWGSDWADGTTVDIYLVPLASASRWWPAYDTILPTYGSRPRLSSARHLGRLKRSGWGDTRLEAHIPEVRPGRYVLGYWNGAAHARWASARPDFQVGTRMILRVEA